MDGKQDDHRPARQVNDYRLSWLIRLPLQLCLDFLNATWDSIRSFIPELIPFAVFVTSIPILLFFSLSAGWYVWRSAAVGWETNVYLQYG